MRLAYRYQKVFSRLAAVAAATLLAACAAQSDSSSDISSGSASASAIEAKIAAAADGAHQLRPRQAPQGTAPSGPVSPLYGRHGGG